MVDVDSLDVEWRVKALEEISGFHVLLDKRCLYNWSRRGGKNTVWKVIRKLHDEGILPTNKSIHVILENMVKYNNHQFDIKENK